MHNRPSAFFQDYSALLTFVLQGKSQEAKEIYKKNPGLLFVTRKAEEYAAGIDENGKAVHRKVKMSPLQAMAASGDGWMLQEALKFLKETNNIDFLKAALNQIELQFPKGYVFPASTYNFYELFDAINNDANLRENTGEPSDETKKLLAKFKRDFLPTDGGEGFLFNLRDLKMPLKMFSRIWVRLSLSQRALIWNEIIGYLERLVTGVDAQIISDRIVYKDFTKGFEHLTLNREAKMEHFATDASHREVLSNGNYIISDKKITYFPLDTDSKDRLGVHFGIDPAYGQAKGIAYGLVANYGYARINDMIKLKESFIPQIVAELKGWCECLEQKNKRALQ